MKIYITTDTLKNVKYFIEKGIIKNTALKEVFEYKINKILENNCKII